MQRRCRAESLKVLFSFKFSHLALIITPFSLSLGNSHVILDSSTDWNPLLPWISVTKSYFDPTLSLTIIFLCQ